MLNCLKTPSSKVKEINLFNPPVTKNKHGREIMVGEPACS